MKEYQVGKYTVHEDGVGNKDWFLNGQLHREDGPAIEWSDGTKHWYMNGKLHREGGPSIEWNDGGKYWYLNGKAYSEGDYKVEMRKRKLERVLG